MSSYVSPYRKMSQSVYAQITTASAKRKANYQSAIGSMNAISNTITSYNSNVGSGMVQLTEQILRAKSAAKVNKTA